MVGWMVSWLVGWMVNLMVGWLFGWRVTVLQRHPFPAPHDAVQKYHLQCYCVAETLPPPPHAVLSVHKTAQKWHTKTDCHTVGGTEYNTAFSPPLWIQHWRDDDNSYLVFLLWLWSRAETFGLGTSPRSLQVDVKGVDADHYRCILTGHTSGPTQYAVIATQPSTSLLLIFVSCFFWESLCTRIIST